LTIDKADRIFVNKVPATLSTLGATLENQEGVGTDSSTVDLVLNIDYNVPHGLVVRCMDQARIVGITQFAIATAPED
jgi:biopolymer transport protein ExbD